DDQRAGGGRGDRHRHRAHRIRSDGGRTGDHGRRCRSADLAAFRCSRLGGSDVRAGRSAGNHLNRLRRSGGPPGPRHRVSGGDPVTRLSTARLLWKHATAGGGASVTVAIVIFALAAIAVGAPRAIQLLVTQSVQHEVRSLPETTRDLVGQGFGGPMVGPSADPAQNGFEPAVDAVWGLFDDYLTEIRRAMPPVVERSVG